MKPTTKTLSVFSVISAVTLLIAGLIYLPKGSLVENNQSSYLSEKNASQASLNKLPDTTQNQLAPNLTDASTTHAANHTQPLDPETVAHDEAPYQRIQRLTNPSDFQQAMAAEQANYHRYPPNVRPLSNDQPDPVVQGYAIDERTTLSDDKRTALTLWTNQKVYGFDDSVEIHAQLVEYSRSDNDIQPGSQFLKGEFRAQLLKQNKVIHEFTFASANTGQIAHTLSLGHALPASASTGIYKILVSEQQTGLTDAITFTLSNPGIELTGNFRDGINEQGDLQLDVEVNIALGGRYYAQASLYSQDDNAMGVTQFSGQLDAGLQWISLTFAGLLFHDLQQDGPYVLKQVSLAKVAMPLERTSLLTPNFETQVYRYDAFSKREYVETGRE